MASSCWASRSLRNIRSNTLLRFLWRLWENLDAANPRTLAMNSGTPHPESTTLNETRKANFPVIVFHVMVFMPCGLGCSKKLVLPTLAGVLRRRVMLAKKLEALNPRTRIFESLESIVPRRQAGPLLGPLAVPIGEMGGGGARGRGVPLTSMCLGFRLLRASGQPPQP